MFRAIGTLLLVYGLAQMFSGAFTALEQAAIESFKAAELAALATQAELQQ